MTKYHTALGQPVAAPLQSGAFTWNGNTGLCHDLLASTSLPPQFRTCDVFYADVPWRDGLDKFERRAGQKRDLTIDRLLTHLAGIIRRDPRPWVIVTGKHAAKHLPTPTRLTEVRLNGARAWAYQFQLDLDLGEHRTLDVVEILHLLAQHFKRVGDPFCGYGRAGRIFQAHGKKWTMSDYNAMCIGFIERECRTWPGAA